MTGTNFSDWYRADEGTLYADYVATQTDIGTVVSVASTGNTNPLGIFENWGGANVRVGIPAVAFLDSSGVAITANTQYKTAFAIKSGDFASSTNASTAQTSSGNYPSYVNNAISLTIGGPSSLGSFQYVNSTIKKISLLPRPSHQRAVTSPHKLRNRHGLIPKIHRQSRSNFCPLHQSPYSMG
jgi:hypothetical protein